MPVPLFKVLVLFKLMLCSTEVDLHLHTTYSDGRMKPKELVRLCKQRGLKTISVTDHDTTFGLGESLKASRAVGIEFIPGIELGTDLEGEEIHVLGYFINEDDLRFQTRLREIREDRLVRAKRIVKKLSDYGIIVSWERVLKVAAGGSVGRPHIAYALVELGYVNTPKEAFESFIGDAGPGFVPRALMSPVEAVELLTNNGALPVLAHPSMSKAKSGRKDINGLEDLIPGLKKAGLIGMEVYYGDYSTDQKRNLNCISQKFGLIPCGGSDYHAAGNPGETEPGDTGPTLDSVEELKSMKSFLRPLKYD